MNNKTEVSIDNGRIPIKLEHIDNGSWFESDGCFYIKMNDMKNDQVECFSFACNNTVCLNNMVYVFLAKKIKIRPVF